MGSDFPCTKLFSKNKKTRESLFTKTTGFQCEYSYSEIYLGAESKVLLVENEKEIEIRMSYSVRDGLYVKIKRNQPYRVLFDYRDGAYYDYDEEERGYTQLVEVLNAFKNGYQKSNYLLIHDRLEEIMYEFLQEEFMGVSTASVKEIIDAWDPIDLLSHAPADEYDLEIQKVEDLFSLSHDVTQLAEGIHTIFIEAFGETAFTADKAECEQIAKRICAKSTPKIRPVFLLTKKDSNDFDRDAVTKKLRILPTKTSEPRLWSLELPKIASWSLDVPLKALEEKLYGKENKVRRICNRYGLMADLIIRVYAEADSMPELSLSKESISFWASMGVSVDFDFYLD